MPDKDKTDKDGKVAPVDAPTSTTAPVDKTDTTVDDKGKTDELILGKYKTQDDLETAYKELESKHGKQSTEVSSLRTAQTDMANKLAKAEADKVKAEGEPKTDYEAQLKEIETQIDNGDITIAEGFRLQGQLVSEMTMAQTLVASEKRTQELLLDKDAEAAEQQWHQDFPDYKDFVESGKAQEYIDKSPMLIDETIAYFMHKETEAEERGRLTAEKTAKGTELTEKVLDVPGETTPRTPTRRTPMSDDELEAEQLKTIAKMRGES